MNMTPERLLLTIGKQQMMIELLQEKVKGLEDEQRSGATTHPSATNGPPEWAKATAAKTNTA